MALAIEGLAAFGGVLLADGVGMGKSFVAAAVAQRSRREVEVVVPAGLVSQWKETLARFGVAATVLTPGMLLSAAPPAVQDRLLIVDEAHVFRNPRTRRYDALARRVVGAAVMLVTATPLCNSLEDLHALLQLMTRDDVLSAAGVPSIDAAFESGDRGAIEAVLSELMIRRNHDVLPDRLRFGDLERSVVRHPVPRVPLDGLSFPLVGSAPLLRRFLHRRLESSPAAMLESIRRMRRFYARVLESGRPLGKREYRRAFAHEQDGDAFQQVLFWDLWSPPGSVDAGSVQRELVALDTLRSVVERAADAKQELLRGELAKTHDPVLVFTGAAATARALGGSICCGVATARDGRAALDDFKRGRIDVLVDTDLASEGLNLQRAGTVIHYDIPWNPVRLDQRNGRAHRIGQSRGAVRAIYFLPRADESRVIATVAAKNRVRRAFVKPSHGAGRAQGSGGLRPRLARGAAALDLIEAAESMGLEVAEPFERRHRAGLERLIEAAVRDGVDRRRLDELLAAIVAER